jgi:predicted small integral membrane protein
MRSLSTAGLMTAGIVLSAFATMHVEGPHASAARVAIIGLTAALLQWLVAFLSVGGEWFLMWQSKNWNGQDAAFRMFAVIGIVLLFLVQSDREGQP